MDYVNRYIQYFRTLAQNHPDIGHNPIDESLDGNPTLCKFGKFWEPNIYDAKPPQGAIYEGITTLVHHVNINTSDNNNNHLAMNLVLRGGLLITARAVKNNIADEERIYNNTFKIVQDYIKEMSDMTIISGNCIGSDDAMLFDFNSLEVLQIGPIWDNRFGYFMTFNFQAPFNLINRTNPFRT